MKNRDVATMLSEIADFLEIQDVEFKPRAYRSAARNIESLSEPIEAVHERGELEEIDGVGESIATKIAEYLETGDLEYHEALKAELPIDIDALTSVEGVGPKTARALYRALGVATLEDLERAAREGRIADVEGFGERSQQNILDHVALAKQGRERMLLGRAVPIATEIERRLLESGSFDRVVIGGSYRRRLPTVGDIDILATAPDPERAMAAFCSLDDVEHVLARGPTKSSVIVAGDLKMDLRIVEPAEFGAALVYFTGSKDHNITLRNRAMGRGWKLNEYGLFDVGPDRSGRGQRAGTVVAGETEAAVYGALDLDWIPPELREDTGEVAAAEAGTLPDLVEPEDIQGDLQCHTEASDGTDSVHELAVAADERGLEYLLITDHGPGAPIPTRLDEASFESQRATIEAVNGDETVSVTVLQGIEAEITTEGLQLPSGWREACDLVVAAIHSQPAEPTGLVVDALETGLVDVLAHPTNRRLNRRAPLDLDLDAVVAAAADADVALEVNAQPERLDLDWQSIHEYRGEVSFVVSTDAHATGEFDRMPLGVSQARRGWCEADDILNTRPLEAVRTFFDR